MDMRTAENLAQDAHSGDHEPEQYIGAAQAIGPTPARLRHRRGMMRRSCRTAGWPLERVLFAMAGTVTLLSLLLAVLVSPWFLLLTAFVGVNQWLYVLVGACPASLVLGRVFALRSVVYPRREARP
jgi:hypothetical protein